MEYRTLLIETDRYMLAELSDVIAGTKGFSLLGRFQDAADALLQAGIYKPNLILLDVDTEENLKKVPELSKAFTGASIICLRQNWDVQGSTEMLYMGAVGYLTKPFSRLELGEAVERFCQNGMATDCDIISFFGPKGKCGKTTLITNLAVSLAHKSEAPVAIIDADLQFGDVAIFFNLMPQSTIVEATRDIKSLSPSLLRPYFVTLEQNVYVLCGTKGLEYAEQVDISRYMQLLRMVRKMFRYVIIDMPPGFCPISIASMEESDFVYITANTDTGFEIQHVRRSLEILHDLDNYQERVRTVFTRVDPCDEESRRKLEVNLGYPVSGLMPNAYSLVATAADKGKVALDLEPDSLLAHTINHLADGIIGKSGVRWNMA
jgi:pilus assembly protein CpaE